MSAARQWRQEIRQVFAAVTTEFELWTNTFCACHVHVSPGPRKASKYNYDQLIQIASASYFWEEALKTILPQERKSNRYAEPNHTAFAGTEYHNVRHYGWAPVFQAIKNAAATGQRFGAQFPPAEKANMSLSMFACLMAGAKATDQDPSETATRYLSSNFLPLPRLGTVELRRQAGVASAYSAIQRALLALTLHVSALRYDFGRAALRKDYATQDELKAELTVAVGKLPASCHGDRFLKWFGECAKEYAANQRAFTEKEVNQREHDLQFPPPPPPAAPPAAPGGRRRSASSARPPAQPSASGATVSRNPRVTPSRQPSMPPAPPAQQPARQPRAVSLPPPPLPTLHPTTTTLPPVLPYPLFPHPRPRFPNTNHR